MLLPHDSTPYPGVIMPIPPDFLPGQANNYYERSIAMPYGRQLRGLGITDVQKTDTMKQIVPVSAGVVPIAINATAGYLVGRLIGYPVAGAVATGALGLLGLLGVAIYAAHAKG